MKCNKITAEEKIVLDCQLMLTKSNDRGENKTFAVGDYVKDKLGQQFVIVEVTSTKWVMLNEIQFDEKGRPTPKTHSGVRPIVSVDTLERIIDNPEKSTAKKWW